MATFELTPPDSTQWRRRFNAVEERELPFATATLDGEVAGHGYCAVGLGLGGRWLDTLLLLHTIAEITD